MPDMSTATFNARRYFLPPLAALAVMFVLGVVGVAEDRPGLVVLGAGVVVLACLICLPIALVAHVRIAGDVLTSSTGASLRAADPGGPVQLGRLSGIISVAHGRYRPLYRTAGLLPTALIELIDADGGVAVIRTFGLSNAVTLRSTLREAALSSGAQLDVNTRRYLGIPSPLSEPPHAGIERRYYLKVGGRKWRIK